MRKLKVIKIGGNVINDQATLKLFLKQFAAIEEPKILVHGGGKIASELANTLKIKPVMVEGRRVTDEAMLDIVVMCYAGLVNKTIVAQLQGLNCNSLGLSGADGNYFKAVKRPVTTIDYGFVGDCLEDSVNTEFIANILSQEITPVCCAITHDKEGNLLNTNADTIAATLAKSLSNQFSVELIYCFELNGLMKNLDDPNSKMSQVSASEINTYKMDGTIHSGMHPKIDNALDAIKNGTETVYICNWKDVHSPKNGTSLKADKTTA